jgi:hypothetical protein
MDQLLLGFGPMSLSVAIHLIGGLALLLAIERRFEGTAPVSLLRSVKVMVLMFTGLMSLHLVQVLAWGLLYRWQIGWDLSTAVYFSTVTYATIGYGDVVPPPDWRLGAAIEGLTGVLMLGWSSALIFMVVNRLYAVRRKARK